MNTWLATAMSATLALTGCATTASEWTYNSPPRALSSVALPAGGAWCETLASAKFMAQTGWFGADCRDDAAAIAGLTVTGIEHFQLQDVRVWVVRARGPKGETFWIPLPDHEWS